MWARAAIAAGGIAAGAGAVLTALTYGGDLYAVTVGVSSSIIGTGICATGVVCRSLRRPRVDVEAAFELGRQVGHDRGYWEGRRTARPVVVPLPRRETHGLRAEVAE